MFIVTAALGALFAAMTAAGPVGGFALLLLVLAVVAHVAGNAIGCRLRTIGTTRDAHAPRPSAERRAEPLREHQFAPASRLHSRTTISRTMIVFTVTGAVLLGIAGSGTLMWLTWGDVNLATVIVALGSSSILGGLLGFICSSFIQVAGGAWWQANCERSRP